MVEKSGNPHPTVTIEEVNRVLEVGRLLLSVLTPEEVQELQSFLSNQAPDGCLASTTGQQIGNTGVT